LLNSVSHDLRTPLSTVLGSSTTLLELGDKLAPEVKQDLLQSIREEAERLNHYIRNLLDMTRLEGGGVTQALNFVRAWRQRVQRLNSDIVMGGTCLLHTVENVLPQVL
jgi:K+-sensing histidine kinase KdpD